MIIILARQGNAAQHHAGLHTKGKNMAAKKDDKPKMIDFTIVERGEIEACLLGVTPFICHSMNSKSKKQLLEPHPPLTRAQKAVVLKHNPLEEFQDSPYTDSSQSGPTYIQAVAVSVKKAMAQIAIDLPDTSMKAAQLMRLLYVPDERIPLWGIPQLDMRWVRNSDKNRTPDIRTRAFIPQWAAKVSITYVMPILTHNVIIKLLATAGFMGGLGDYRVQKGGPFGTFEVVNPDDPRFKAIVKHGGRKAQKAAMNNPEFFNDDTRDLFEWHKAEIIARGRAKPKRVTKKAS